MMIEMMITDGTDWSKKLSSQELGLDSAEEIERHVFLFFIQVLSGATVWTRKFHPFTLTYKEK